MVALLLVVPNHHHSDSERPLLSLYERLAPFEAMFNRPDSAFLMSGYPIEIHDYVGHNYFTSPLVNFDYTILGRAPANRPLPSFLDHERVTLFYIDGSLWRTLSANPVHQPLLVSPESAGSKLLACQDTDPEKTGCCYRRGSGFPILLASRRDRHADSQRTTAS